MNNDPHHDHSHHHQAPLPTCFSSLQVRRGPCLPPFPQSSSSSSEESVLFSERLEANSGYSLTTQHGSCLRELAKGMMWTRRIMSPNFVYEFPYFPSSNIWFNSLRVMRTQSQDWRPFACLSFRLFASEIRKGQIQARDPPVVLFSIGILNIEDINQIWVFSPNLISCRQHVIRA